MKVLFMFALLILPACTGASAPGQGTCRRGVCVRLLIGEPVLLNAPVVISIIVQTEEDIPGLVIAFPSTDARILVEGERQWTINALANQPITLTKAVRFTEEGHYFILAQADDRRKGMVLGDSARIDITRAGGTVYYSGTPLPITPVRIVTPSILTPLPYPTPTRAPYP